MISLFLNLNDFNELTHNLFTNVVLLIEAIENIVFRSGDLADHVIWYS